jgi:shikimate 5-dehydrogenase
MYFIGVTTAQSSIHQIFPHWATAAGVKNAAIQGIDLPLDATPNQYRAAVHTILQNPNAQGALITTHKVGIYEHAPDLFTDFDPDARRLGEVSCIVKRGTRLTGLAMDTVAGPLALQALDWHGPAALILGAGGAGLALAVSLPVPVVLTDISRARLEKVRHLTAARCEQVATPEDNDSLLAAMPPGSLIVNATGMGKDRPGAPITPHARFPTDALAWDLNYRGKLLFLDYARAQGIRTADGWEYFLHGWTQIMARVFGFDLTPELFKALRRLCAPPPRCSPGPK